MPDSTRELIALVETVPRSVLAAVIAAAAARLAIQPELEAAAAPTPPVRRPARWLTAAQVANHYAQGRAG